MLNHQGTVVLTTQRLTLRPFRVADAQGMYDNWASDPQVTRYLTWSPHKNVSETTALLKDWCTLYSVPTYYNWVIELDGQPIGNVSVVRSSDKDERAELGYCMGRAFWNQGIMTEAVRAIIDFLFETVGLNRVEIWGSVFNPASGRVAEKCGLTREGIWRQYHRVPDGTFHDVVCYSILREEWTKNHK